jgi:F0F1-type ATP synthase membrane subunit b/b'
MSASERVRKSVDQTIRSTQEFIENTKRSLQAELAKKAPKIEHDLDKSVDDAGRALSNALTAIGMKTSHEQMELLKGYRAFLQGQVAFVERRIKALSSE